MTTSTYRVTYGKGPALRFLGHLDLARLWQRVLRRAGVRLAFTEGYRPRPKIATGPPLSLGFTSRVEVLELTLTEAPTPDALRERLRPVVPPGLDVLQIEPVTATTPTLATIETLSYTVTLPPTAAPVDPAALAVRARTLLAATTLPVVRRRKGREKTYDLRPSLRDLTIAADGTIRLHVTVTPAGTANPREVLALLGDWDEDTIRTAAIERHALTFASPTDTANTDKGFNGYTTPTDETTHTLHPNHG